MTGMSIPEQFRNLQQNPAFQKLQAYVKELTATEEEKYWNIDDNQENEPKLRAQRLRVKHYKDLWSSLEVYIVNSASQKENK